MTERNEPTLRYRVTPEEAARQGFVLALKRFANADMEKGLADLFELRLKPEFERKQGRAPQSRDEAKAVFEGQPLFQFWEALAYNSQDLLWSSCADTVERENARLKGEYDVLTSRKERLGSLSLDPTLEMPEPMSHTDIHRMPGGYQRDQGGSDMWAGLMYHTSVDIYLRGKGETGFKPDFQARLLAKIIREKYPALNPKRILEIGCGPGTQTAYWPEAFPEAEVHAIDVGPAMLRYAHGLAEAKGVAVHYHQMNAAKTTFEDGRFDLIVSIATFHETSSEILPAVMREAKRLLAPGGVFINLDVPYQTPTLPLVKQVTNDWQVLYNGEPFWTGFGDTDAGAALKAAGFPEAGVFAYHDKTTALPWYVFGGQKPAA
jgi:SAM-dependent methyltransferase